MLLVCNSVSHRSDVKTAGKSLDYWVKQSQGENAQVRSRRNPGLIWALTPFDQRIASNGAKASDGAKTMTKRYSAMLVSPVIAVGVPCWHWILAA